QLRRVEAHGKDRVRPHRRRVRDHPIDRLPAGILQQRGVLVDLATAEGTQECDDVTTQSATSHHDAEYLAPGFDHPLASDEVSCGDNHGMGLASHLTAVTLPFSRKFGNPLW